MAEHVLTPDPPPTIYEALLAVQAAAPTLPKPSSGQVGTRSYKYTPLDTIVETIGPLLNQHGLVWVTRPSGTHDEPTLEYDLYHAPTGTGLSGTMPLLLDKPSAQAFGSAITYARRYALCAVLNLVADDDDDGHAASTYARQRQPAARPAAGDDPTIDEPSGEDAARIKALLKEHNITTKKQAAELFRQLFGRDPSGASFVASLRRNEAGIVIARLEQGALPTGKSDATSPEDEAAFEQPALPEDGERPPWEHDAVTQS